MARIINSFTRKFVSELPLKPESISFKNMTESDICSTEPTNMLTHFRKMPDVLLEVTVQ